MRSWVLAACLLAGAAFVPTAAYAADVDDDDDRGAYSDPRRKVPPPQPGYNDQDDDDDDDRPPPGKKYSGPPPSNKYSGMQCARSEQVRQRLTDSGWLDFHAGHQQGDMVVMRARRPSGRLFELTLHRCSGQVVEVRPLEARSNGPYAFNRPYKYDRPPPNAPYGGKAPYSYDDDRWSDRPYAYGGPRRWWWYRD